MFDVLIAPIGLKITKSIALSIIIDAPSFAGMMEV